MTESALVTAVNVGEVRVVEWEGRRVSTGIWKSPVQGRRRLAGVNVDGDDQADRQVHGGSLKAVYAYGEEDYRWWSQQLGYVLGPGSFGENLTMAGVDLREALVGERWRVGTAVLRVTQPRAPCFKLGIRMSDRRFPARFAEAGRPGAYLAIEQEGEVGAGDRRRVLSQPSHRVTVGLVERAYHHDRRLAAQLVDVEELPHGWRAWARTVVE